MCFEKALNSKFIKGELVISIQQEKADSYQGGGLPTFIRVNLKCMMNINMCPILGETYCFDFFDYCWNNLQEMMNPFQTYSE